MRWEHDKEGFHLHGETIEEVREVLASLEEHLKPLTEEEHALFVQLVEEGHPVITDGDEIVGVMLAGDA